ncbi:MAG TPA: hypothetical protein VIP75_05805 [Acidothermales bacterium]
MGQHIGTLPAHRSAEHSRRARNIRRIGIVALTIFVLTGLVGVLGPRASDVSASGGGYELNVRYAQITRSGLVAPLRVLVQRPGGFDGPITLAFSKDIFDRFDFQNWYPNPSAETAGPQRLEYEFDPPLGEAFELTLDVRVGPTQPPSAHRYWVAVIEDDLPVARVDFRMVVMP